MSIDADFILDRATRPKPALRRESLAESSAAASAYRVVDLTTREAILGIKQAWHRLAQVSEGSTVFQAFDLCLPWLDAYVFGEAPTHQAHVLAFYNPVGEMVALAPFAQKTSGLVRAAEWIGDPLVQYGDILLDPSADRMALRRALTDMLDTLPIGGLHLRNVREDARIAQVIDLSASTVGEPREALMIDLTGFKTADDYFASLSKSARANRKRKRRALEKSGALSFDVVPAGERAAKLCRLALDWKVAWLDERGQSSRAFLDVRALEVLCNAVAREGAANPFQVFVESVDKVPVTIEIGLVGPLGNAMFIASYDPSYENLSPGKVRIESTIVHGFEEGWPLYDMLPPFMDYKKSWTNTTVRVNDHMIPATGPAKLYRDGYLRLARPAMKTVWNAIPPSLRGRVLRRGKRPTGS